MSLIYYLLAIGLCAWLVLALHVWSRKGRTRGHGQIAAAAATAPRHRHVTGVSTNEEINLNPKVNLGRAASVHSIQGQRSHMEDAYYGDYTKGFFAVYDGHGGARCSSYAAQNLHELIFKHNYTEQPQLALQEGFKALDHHWLELAALNGWDDGSTGVCVLIVDRVLYVANAGDSRAVLCSAGGRAVVMSDDHKPNRTDERLRIEALGGRIIHYGTWRVQGVLAVTRSFGDRKLKQFVSAEPEIKSWPLQDGDDFLILASDGVWDVLSNQMAVDIVRKSIADSAAANGTGGGNGHGSSSSGGGTTGGDVREAAEKLTNTAYAYHSQDNITSLVIDLRQFR